MRKINLDAVSEKLVEAIGDMIESQLNDYDIAGACEDQITSAASDAVESISIDDKISDAVDKHDFSDYIADAIADYDFENEIEKCLANSSVLDDKVDYALDERSDKIKSLIDDAIAEFTVSKEFENLILSIVNGSKTSVRDTLRGWSRNCMETGLRFFGKCKTFFKKED